jgi:hypothetical protein
MSQSHRKPIAATLLFGLASVVLYALLLLNSDLFVEWAQRTKEGEKSLFLIPIVVAFIFSYFHGTFTGHFWETMGLRAAKTITKK